MGGFRVCVRRNNKDGRVLCFETVSAPALFVVNETATVSKSPTLFKGEWVESSPKDSDVDARVTHQAAGRRLAV